MGLIYFLGFFTLIAAVILVWALVQLWNSTQQAENNQSGDPSDSPKGESNENGTHAWAPFFFREEFGEFRNCLYLCGMNIKDLEKL